MQHMSCMLTYLASQRRSCVEAHSTQMHMFILSILQHASKGRQCMQECPRQGVNLVGHTADGDGTVRQVQSKVMVRPHEWRPASIPEGAVLPEGCPPSKQPAGAAHSQPGNATPLSQLNAEAAPTQLLLSPAVQQPAGPHEASPPTASQAQQLPDRTVNPACLSVDHPLFQVSGLS